MCSEITIKTKIMNDTRKQIIEIIEPYMDKTLSEGCLVKIGHKYSYIYSKYDALLDRSPTTPYLEKSIWNIKHSIGNNYELCVFDQQKNKDGSYNILSTKDTFKILGHYDIGSFVKFFGSLYPGHTISIDEGGCIIKIHRRKFEYEYITLDNENVKLPLKSPNSWNKEEEEKVLFFIKGLWKTGNQ